MDIERLRKRGRKGGEKVTNRRRKVVKREREEDEQRDREKERMERK